MITDEQKNVCFVQGLHQYCRFITSFVGRDPTEVCVVEDGRVLVERSVVDNRSQVWKWKSFPGGFLVGSYR